MFWFMNFAELMVVHELTLVHELYELMTVHEQTMFMNKVRVRDQKKFMNFHESLICCSRRFMNCHEHVNERL